MHTLTLTHTLPPIPVCILQSSLKGNQLVIIVHQDGVTASAIPIFQLLHVCHGHNFPHWASLKKDLQTDPGLELVTQVYIIFLNIPIAAQ